MERLSRRAWRARALVAANVVVALSTVRARERVLLAFVDVPADSIVHQNKSLGADAEAHLAALVDALLVLRAGIGRGAVDARQNAEIVPLQERLRATAAISEALKVSWTLVVMDARSSNGALHVGISTKSTGAVAFWAVIHTTAFGTTTADTRLQASVVALLGKGVAGLVVFAVGVPGAALDALTATPVVGVAHQVVGAAALVAARQVAAGGTVGARAQAVQALVDVFALLVDAHISRAAVAVFQALRQGNQAAAIGGVAGVAGEALAGGLVVVCAALGVDATDPAQVAGVLADAVDAGLVQGAVVVAAAAHNTSG
uniref:Putative secreted protein n=1 Tax=Ixodes ricinus TaxID=34613 RepID=A0A6B0V924_IXORI